MGLTAYTEDREVYCFDGSYSTFSFWRIAVCQAAGYGNLLNYRGFNGDNDWPEVNDVLLKLLNHSDCDGILPADICGALATRLQELQPAIAALKEQRFATQQSNLSRLTENFIIGLEYADRAVQNVVFG